MTEYLLNRDLQTGIYETFEYDEATGDITIRRWADVQPVLDANKSFHLESDGKGKDAWLAARIATLSTDDRRRLADAVGVLEQLAS